MLQGILIITIIGFFAGEIARRLRLPRLIGMIIAGIIIGPHALGILPREIMNLSEEIRLFALLVILFKAGLGLDKNKILSQGSVAIRLAFLPAVIEASVVAVAAHLILGWDWLLAWLLGWIICAASPAVIVPMMLRLKSEGWGVNKGIPDLILAGGTASDAVAVTMFGITLAWVTGDFSGGWATQVLSIPLQVVGGIALGYLAARLVLLVIKKIRLAGNIIHKLIISLGAGLLLVLLGDIMPFSAFLAVMVLGFSLLEKDPVLARRVRSYLDDIWVVGQIFLFVLIGAEVDTGVILQAGPAGLAVIGIGLLVGRWAGIFASTWGSIITIKERFFMVIGDMAKATVQAAIGGIPLAMGVPNGEYILAISVLAILLSAPLGAWGTLFFAPRVLEKGKVDPTKVRVQEKYKFLVAFDGTPSAESALRQAARLSRQMDAHLYILNVHSGGEKSFTLRQLRNIMENLASDIAYELETVRGNPEDVIPQMAGSIGVDYIFMGKGNNGEGIGDISEQVIRSCSAPVILLEPEEEL